MALDSMQTLDSSIDRVLAYRSIPDTKQTSKRQVDPEKRANCLAGKEWLKNSISIWSDLVKSKEEKALNLVKAGVQVALIIYCPYHSRPLLCDFPSDAWLTQARSVVQQTQTGSKTDYCNVNLLKMRTFTEFMAAHFAVPVSTSQQLVKGIRYSQDVAFITNYSFHQKQLQREVRV